MIVLFVVFLGLIEYDPDDRKAKALEDAVGIKVIRHSQFVCVILIPSFFNSQLVNEAMK